VFAAGNGGSVFFILWPSESGVFFKGV